ncbi:cache domain-containing protein [bacterium]|nr:MAG: cache domain-containing protein [bacterium]
MTDATAVSQVLQHNQTYTGSVTINNRPYLTAITPLVDVNNQPVGMLQAARPATDLFAAADHSLQLMLLLASALVLLAALPLFKLAKYIERQLQ